MPEPQANYVEESDDAYEAQDAAGEFGIEDEEEI